MRISEINRAEFDRFDPLRGPYVGVIIHERSWFASEDRALLGVVTFDTVDNDWGCVVLGRAGAGAFQVISVHVSLSSFIAAKEALIAVMSAARVPADSAPQDLLTPVVPVENLHPGFRTLIDEPGYEPARQMIRDVFSSYVDRDGNFIQQFQTTGFDQRIWELFLYAALKDIGCSFNWFFGAPDFLVTYCGVELAVEATTANPPGGGVAGTCQ